MTDTPAQSTSTSAGTSASTSTGPQQVLSVDDNPMIGDVIGMLLESDPGLSHAGHFVSDAGVLETIQKSNIKVVLLDYEIPGTDTLSLLRQMRSLCPDCRVLMLSAHARPSIVNACRKAGASGYLIKDANPDRILEAIRHIAAGNTFFTQKSQAIINTGWLNDLLRAWPIPHAAGWAGPRIGLRA